MSEKLINITVDGVTLQVTRGATILQALNAAGVEVPHFCYHAALKIYGSCKMCRVQVNEDQNLVLACNTPVIEGMKIATDKTSKLVADAIKATLEFLFINHPLDCTICDQSGQCLLQKYYIQYSNERSRFFEIKEQDRKAELIGDEVIYDPERCINCTRCVRFCREVTKTNELAILNRGDKSIVGIFPNLPLNNPFSGTVCDICPVGAMTHRQFRFKACAWQTEQVRTVCPGCSTGCEVLISLKDNKVVQVRGVEGDATRGFLCNEGRYGFSRFNPVDRLMMPMIRDEFNYEMLGKERLIKKIEKFKQDTEGESAMFLSPFLTQEEFVVALKFAENFLGLPADSENISVVPFARTITGLENILISPNYAPNLKCAEKLGIVKNDKNLTTTLDKRYHALLDKVKIKKVSQLVVLGDYAVCAEDIDEEFIVGVLFCNISLQTTTRQVQSKKSHNHSELHSGTYPFCEIVLPSKTVLEKSGTLVNIAGKERKLNPLFEAPEGCLGDSEWLKIIS